MRHEGRFSLAGALAAVLALGISADAGQGARGDARTRLGAARSFAFAIGDGTLAGNLSKRYARFDLVVVDGEAASARAVAAIRRTSHGLVLGYLDIGTIEPYRGWYSQARRYRLDYWSDWGEWYANVNAAGYRRLLLERVAPAMLARGFDGLFLDNTDMTGTHPGQKPGMRKLVAGFSRLARGRGLVLMTQNGAAVNWPLRRFYDAINCEDVSFGYDFARRAYVRRAPAAVARAQREMRRYRGAGLVVTATDYLPAGAGLRTATAVRNACAAGALPYVSDIDLTRIPPRPFLCN
jgi:endo-alpha-1,4-polygalactosaminidase (GH114 family)